MMGLGFVRAPNVHAKSASCHAIVWGRHAASRGDITVADYNYIAPRPPLCYCLLPSRDDHLQLEAQSRKALVVCANVNEFGIAANHVIAW